MSFATHAAKRSNLDQLDLFGYDVPMPATIDMPPPLSGIPALPAVDGGFKTVLADPPWQFNNRTGKMAPEHKRLSRYATLDLGFAFDLVFDESDTLENFSACTARFTKP